MSAGDTALDCPGGLWHAAALVQDRWANGLGSDADLQAGQVLTIPAQASGHLQQRRGLSPLRRLGHRRRHHAQYACTAQGTTAAASWARSSCWWWPLWWQSSLAHKTGPVRTRRHGLRRCSRLGSIASQMVGMAIGAVDSFSWKAVALAALVRASLRSRAAWDCSKHGSESWMAQGFQRHDSQRLTQGIAVATGLQDKFSWRGVAAAGVGRRWVMPAER